jgi:hypothetical protein
VGYVFLLFALGFAVFMAIYAPRAGILLGGALLLAGFLPLVYLLVAQSIFGVPGKESDGMLVVLSLWFLGAPGFMLLALSLLFGGD